MRTNRQSDIHGVCRNLVGAITIGLDLGDKNTNFCILSADGGLVAEGKFATTPEEFKRQFESVVRCRIALEVGAHSRWANRALGALGHEVIVANARKVRLIKESDNKTDKMDARTLARLARVDPMLLSPISHRGRETYPDMARIRARALLVRSRTRLINAVRGIVKATGSRLVGCTSRTFAKKMACDLPKELEPSLKPLIDTIAYITQQIALGSGRYSMNRLGERRERLRIELNTPGPIDVRSMLEVLEPA